MLNLTFTNCLMKNVQNSCYHIISVWRSSLTQNKYIKNLLLALNTTAIKNHSSYQGQIFLMLVTEMFPDWF